MYSSQCSVLRKPWPGAAVTASVTPEILQGENRSWSELPRRVFRLRTSKVTFTASRSPSRSVWLTGLGHRLRGCKPMAWFRVPPCCADSLVYGTVRGL